MEEYQSREFVTGNTNIEEIVIENIRVVSCGKKLCIHKKGYDGIYLAPRVWNNSEMDYLNASNSYMYEGSSRECNEYQIYCLNHWDTTRPLVRARTDLSDSCYVWKIYGEYFDKDSQTTKKCVLIVEDKLDIELDKYISENGIDKIVYKYVKQYDDYTIGKVHADEKQSIAQAFHITVDDADRLIIDNEFVLLQAKYGESKENSTKELAEKALSYKYRDTNERKFFWTMLKQQNRVLPYLLCNFFIIIYIMFIAMLAINKVKLDEGIVGGIVLYGVVILIVCSWVVSNKKRIRRIKKIKW